VGDDDDVYADVGGLGSSGTSGFRGPPPEASASSKSSMMI
jgi:hypothetical protein